MRSNRLDVKKMAVTRSMRCGDLFFEPGAEVDAARIDPMTFAVFLSNGWWAVDAVYFGPLSNGWWAVEAVDALGLTTCERCGAEIDGGCFDCAVDEALEDPEKNGGAPDAD